MQPDYSLSKELNRLLRRKWWIAGFTLVVAILAFILTGPAFMPPEFKSSSEMIPPNLRLYAGSGYYQRSYDGVGVGQEVDIEQLNAALQTPQCVEYMIDRFKLVEHYALDEIEDDKTRNKRLMNYIEENLQVSVSRNSTVLVEVYDQDPEFAARVAQEYIHYADSIIENFTQRRRYLTQLNESIAELKAEMREMQDTLRTLRTRYGVYDLRELSEASSRRIMRSFDNPDFQANYDRLVGLDYRMEMLSDEMAGLVRQRSFLRENLEAYPSLLWVVGEPVPARVKSRPLRAIYFLLSVLGGFAFACLVVILVDRDWKDTPPVFGGRKAQA